MVLSFDPEKRRKILEERGLDFLQAPQVFAGLHLTLEDDRQDYGERRFNTFGFINDRAVFITWTLRDGGIRVISMRRANEREKARYRRQLG